MIIIGKSTYDQSIYSDLQRYEKIRNLTRGIDEDYTTGCLLDYEYIKKFYRLIAVNLTTQKRIRC